MINLPHIGLYGDLSACEDGMIDALNRNFSLLDAIVQLKVLDFVTDLPVDPEKGDVYILNTPLDPSTDKDLMIFNGVNWVQIIPQDGFIAYIDSQESFYYYNDGEWIKDLTDLSEIKLKLARATSTGVIDGLNLSVNSGDNAEFDIATGIYEIVDLSDVNNPVVKTIEYAGSTGNVVTNLATQDVTYISLDEDGVIHQSINFPTPNERRLYAFVGRLNHTNRTSISFADTFPDFKLSPVASFYDLVDALAPFKMDQGLKTTPNGANLSFDVSAGKVFFRSDNYTTDKNNPHTKSFNDQVLAPFRKMTQTSTVDAADVTVLEPSYYDVAGARTLIAGGPNHATIQRIYKYKSGAIRVAYGQNVYANMSAAREAVNFDSFTENPTINQTAVLIALVIITKGCTDLSDPSQCVILPASRFGSFSGGGGGGTGSGVMVVADLTARNNIPEGTRTNGMLVEVVSTDTIYKLIGLPAGATTTDANWDPVITGKAVQTLTNKDIDGGTASNTSRLTTPKGSIESLAALARKEATLLYNTSGKRGMLDDGTALKGIPDFGNLDVLKQFVATNMLASDFQVNPLVDTVSLTKVTSPLLGDCFEINVGSSVATDGFSIRPVVDIAVAQEFRNQRVQFTYDYASEIAQGSIAFEILDQTNSVVLVNNTELQARPSATGITTKGFIYFTIPASCQALRIYMLRPSGSATITSKKFWFNNWEIKKFSQTLGPVITNWQSYTPTISADSGTLTNFTVSGRWRQVGDSIEVEARLEFIGAVGTWTGPNFSLPSGLSFNTNNILSTYNGFSLISDGGAAFYSAVVQRKGTNAFGPVSPSVFTHTGTVPTRTNSIDNNYPMVWAPTDVMNVSFRGPIQGWSSTARYADYTLNQDVSFYATKNADQTGIAVNNSGALITFPTVRVDKASCYESNGYRVKSKDLYKIEASAQLFGGNVLLSQSYEIRVYVNSVFRERIAAVYPNAAGMAENLSGECLIDLEYNDLVQLYLYSTGNHSTNTLTLQPTTNMVVTKASTSQQLFAPTNVEVGIAQNYVDVTASRSSGVTYTNNTSRPIMVHLSGTSNTSTDYFGDVTVGGVVISSGQGSSQGTAGPYRICLQPFMVPPAATYSVIINSIESLKWVELR